MDETTDQEREAMTQLHMDIVRLMMEAIDDGMEQEQAIFVAGNVALICMEKMPQTDEGAGVLQNFVHQVADLMGGSRPLAVH